MNLHPSRRPPAVPPDLASHEETLAARFGALARAVAPDLLRARCLQPQVVQPQVVLRARGAPALVRWTTQHVALAASVLVALGTLALAGSSGSTHPLPDAASASLATAGARLRVVDDPSVPLFHALETFDQLAAVSPTAVGSADVGSAGVRSVGERGGR